MYKNIFGITVEGDKKKAKKNIKNKKNIDTGEKYENNRIHFNNNIKLNIGTKEGLSINHIKILKECNIENTAKELMKILNRSNASKFKNVILNPLLEFGYLERTIKENPKSPKQKYRLTNRFIKSKDN